MSASSAMQSGTKRARFQEDYEEVPETNPNKVTRKERKKKRRRRARTDMFEDDEEVILPKLDAVAALRSKSLKIQSEETDDDDEGDGRFQISLRHARDTMRQALTDASNSRIKSLVESAETDGNSNDNKNIILPDDIDGGENNNAKVLNETELFARNINADIETTTTTNVNPLLSSTNDSAAENGKATGIEEGTVEKRGVQEAEAANENKDAGGEVERVGEKCDIFGDAGVAAALARFRSMGNLNRKVEQYGRAKDERLAINDDNNDNDVRLNYTDEYGRELTAKEAFRLMCHKFHGKGPSKNKRETRLRRELRELRLKQMETDDTPLGSTAALREETRRTGVAHVVLSGPQAALEENTTESALTKDTDAGQGAAPQ